MLKLTNISQLRRMYDSACEVDKALFAEQRTNIKLRNGDHYNTTTRKIINNMRSKGIINNDQKIRITKNHVFRITDEYINHVLSANPSVEAAPYNASELQDVKDAEMCNSVIKWVKATNTWNEKRHDLIHNTNVIGETYTTVNFDYDKGRVVGTNEDGTDMMNGEIVIKERFAYDTKRDPDAKSFRDCRYVMFDTLMDRDEAVKLVSKHRPEKASSLMNAQEGDTITIFDNNTGKYQQENGKVLIIEMFVRPCSQYPKGKFLMFTKEFEIFRADLPLGLFTVYQSGFSKITSTPRYAAITRVIRPYQTEINRASSKMAEHQITLGDDKIITQNGGKIRSSSKEAGIRVLSVDGGSPTVLAGRTGAQYLEYVSNELAGMYQAAGVQHLLDNSNQAGDPFLLLFQTMKQKAKFVNYMDNYANFEKAMFTDIIKLCKHYLDDTHLIKIMGKKEAVNIAEFKDIDDDSLDITVENSNGDIETKFGKVLTITQIMQYAGSSMTPEQLGTLIKQLPYGNNEEIFNPLTLNYDTATNIILAMDRGEQPYIPQYADIDFMLKAISGRTVKGDFSLLPPQVQQQYIALIQQLEQVKSGQLLQAQQAAQGMIPAGGFLTTVNASWKNPTSGKVERIKIPSDAIGWLAQKLTQQGAFAQELQGQAPQVQAEIGTQAVQQAQQQQQIAPQVQGV